MDKLTRSQRPDLRLFTQVPGKLAWYSNRSWKTRKGAEGFLQGTVLRTEGRRGIGYKVITDVYGEYRLLATPVKKEEVPA